MKIVFHDTETTGIDAEDRILQSAHAVFDFDPGTNTMELQSFREEIIKPPVPCKPEAAAVHGIWKTDYENAPSWEESASKKELEALSQEGAVYVAHNAMFDLVMLEKEGIVWGFDNVIDTLLVAQHLFREEDAVERSSLQYLRYFFDFDSSEDFQKFVRQFGIERLQAHTALSDIVVLAYLFQKFVQEHGYETVKNLAHTPFLQDKVFFGNVFERGSSLEEAISGNYEQYGRIKRGVDYFKWAFDNMENLDLFSKISIANAAMMAVLNKKIALRDPALRPMLLTAHAFLPEYWPLTDTVLSDEVRKKVQEKAKNSAEEKGDLVERKRIDFLLYLANKKGGEG